MCVEHLSDMKMESGGRRTTGSNVNRIYVMVGCLFALLILGLVSATLHYVIQIWNDTADSSPSPLDSAETSLQFLRNLHLRTRFPGYFRSSVEQNLVQKMILNSSFSAAPNGYMERLMNTAIGMRRKHPEWTQIPVGFKYNACCNSSGYYEFPIWMIDMNGKNRTLATFNGMMQHFYKEDCKQMTGCTTCKCETQISYVTAVVKDDNTGYEVAWFQRPVCCSCINRLL